MVSRRWVVLRSQSQHVRGLYDDGVVNRRREPYRCTWWRSTSRRRNLKFCLRSGGTSSTPPEAMSLLNAEEAALAYDRAARSMRVTSARTNFVYSDMPHSSSVTFIVSPDDPPPPLRPLLLLLVQTIMSIT
ncbi:unnamed protein product [Brassica oleracea]